LRYRVLAVPLREVAATAALHHGRVDGSGYHRGLHGADIPFGGRLLAAAEMYQSMREDSRAVDLVLKAAGQPPSSGRSGRPWPADLTDREVEVLRAIAVGLTNRQAAARLHVSEATVHTHVINIYGKVGVNTRAGATLFAMENDLLDARPSSETRR
jgi:DNA-binding CsgD family transcriptional regulator